MPKLSKRRDKAFHLYNWYCWEKEGYPVPPNVVGTDDTDIFATNIYNEYCNIFLSFCIKKDEYSGCNPIYRISG